MRRMLMVAAALAAVAVVAPVSQAVAACPNGIQQRKEIRTVVYNPDLTRFLDAVKTLQKRASPTALSVWDKLVKRHLDAGASIHGYAEFFPWHRRFLLSLETELQKINPLITIPYWNTALDAAAPETSPVFASYRFGGNGDPVKNGPFANLSLLIPSSHLLARSWDLGTKIATFYTSAEISASLNVATTYDRLRYELEAGPHGVPHLGIGGDLRTYASPNDPLFWLHHANLDRLWSVWQARNPAYMTSYGGRRPGGSAAAATDSLAGYGLERVSSMFSIAALCYSYQPPSSTATPNRATLRQATAAPAPPLEIIPTEVALSVDRTVVTPSQPVTMTATVESSEGAGAVAFLADGTVISGCASIPLAFTGVTWQAACETTGLPSANPRLTARFLGIGAFAASESPSIVVAVRASAPAVTFDVPARARYGDPLGNDRLNATAGQPGTFAYSVAPVRGGAARPAPASLVLDVGEYDLRAAFTPADGSPVQAVTVPHVVERGVLEVRAEDKDIARGERDPELSWVASGFVDGDNPSDLLQGPACAIEGEDRSVGKHVIRCSGGASHNYRFVHTDTGTLTIRRKRCKDGTACESDDPPTASERSELNARRFICVPAPDRSDRKFLDKDEDVREDVDETTWRSTFD